MYLMKMKRFIFIRYPKSKCTYYEPITLQSCYSLQEGPIKERLNNTLLKVKHLISFIIL